MTFQARSSVSLIWAIALTMVLSTVPLRPVQAQTDQTKPAASDAQKEKEAEQRKELEKKTLALLNDVAAGAWSLKLPENRLLIMSDAAYLLWPFDEKRARAVYWDALNSLNLMTSSLRANTGQKLSKEERIKVWQSYLAMFELRQRLVRQVAARDGQLALDMLRATRQVPPKSIVQEFHYPDDLQLEQGIAIEVAARDPAQALQVARQSLAKGISFEVLNLWQRLHQFDSEKASQFASEVVAKLRTVNLSNDFHARIIASQFLLVSRAPEADEQTRLVVARNAKPLRLDDEQRRDLVDALSNAALSASASAELLVHIPQVMREIEEFFPERRATLDRKLAGLNVSQMNGNAAHLQLDSLISGGTPEEIMRRAATANDDTRLMLYHNAAMSALGQGKSDSFRELANKEIRNEDERTKVLDALDSSEISMAVGLKQRDQLEKLLPKIRDKVERARAMAELALMLKEKGENEEATALLDEASTVIKTDLRDDKQTNALLALLCAYAVVDPPKAFALAERTVDRANSQISLLLLLDKVVKSGAVKKNEIRLEQPNLMSLDFIVFKFGKGVAALARADFNRTKALADRFERNELRLMAQLLILKGLLAAEPSGSDSSSLIIEIRHNPN